MRHGLIWVAALGSIAIAGCGSSDSAAGDDDYVSGDGSSPSSPGLSADVGGEDGADAADGATEDDRGSSSVASGQLTAGMWDDNLNFDRFLDFVGSVGQAARGPDAGDRVEIVVVDGDAVPVSNAWVSVSTGQQALVEAPTGTDGRLLFFPTADGAPEQPDYSVSVSLPEATDQAKATIEAPEGNRWKIEIPGAAAAAPSGLDLAFVVDATGSMSDELEYLKSEVASIAASVDARFPNVSKRYGLVVYRDHGDAYVTRPLDFAAINEFQANLAAQRAEGGGDYPEAMDQALGDMNQLSWRFNANVARLAFLVADAPPHDAAVSAYFTQVDRARLSGVRLYPVASSGVDLNTEYLMRSAAQWTLGRYIFLTDDSGIGGEHLEPTIPCYAVEKLNLLMTRVVVGELDGVLTPPLEENVVRWQGEIQDGVCTLPDESTALLW